MDLDPTDLNKKIVAAIRGQPLATVQSELAAILIAYCLAAGWPKHAVLNAISEQWDMMRDQRREIDQAQK